MKPSQKPITREEAERWNRPAIGPFAYRLVGDYLRALRVIEAIKRMTAGWAGEHMLCPEEQRCSECDLLRELEEFEGGKK